MTYNKQVCQNICRAAWTEARAVYSKLPARFNWRCRVTDCIALALQVLDTSSLVQELLLEMHDKRQSYPSNPTIKQGKAYWIVTACPNMYLLGSPHEASRVLLPQAKCVFRGASAVRWWNKHYQGKTEWSGSCLPMANPSVSAVGGRLHSPGIHPVRSSLWLVHFTKAMKSLRNSGDLPWPLVQAAEPAPRATLSLTASTFHQ